MGAYMTLRNAKIDMFKGSMRLAVDQWGKVEALESASFDAKVRWRASCRITACAGISSCLRSSSC